MSEPLGSATRVRPPGSTQVSLPVTAKGRRSTWRGSTAPSPFPFSPVSPFAPTSVGQTERSIVGWLI